MEFLSGLIGALVGGAFVLAGSWLQGRTQLAQVRERFEHERQLAAEDHARREISDQNDFMWERIKQQIDHGRMVMVAAARFQNSPLRSPGRTEQAATEFEILRESTSFAGIGDFNRSAPYADWVSQEEIEDEKLRTLVGAHSETVRSVDFALMMADGPPPGWDRLPPNCIDTLEEVAALADSIAIRCRMLQRDGRAF